ncbi:MAG: DUF4013 domain-containing protein [Methanoculleus sp.]|jgi:hypothetical protein
MDYGAIVSGAFGYTKETLWGRWGRWIILVILSLIQIFTLFLVPLYSGYIVRVLSGRRPAPDVEGWGRLFVDGWKWNIINLIYAIPTILVLIYFGGLAALSAIGAQGATDSAAWIPVLAAVLLGLLLAGLVAVLISFVSLFAVVRFAQTGKFVEAFRLGTIFAQIGKIGWGAWILAVIILIVIGLVYSFVVGLLANIPILGWIISLFLGVAYGVFHARYLAEVYESVGGFFENRVP